MKITPTSEQQRILDLGATSIRVRAGAGTGKTTTVALVIANLVNTHGMDPERILGITFTNKAASELGQKVSQFLEGVVDPARQVEVHTYHGFAAQILAEFGVLAGVDLRAGVVTPTFARQIIRDVFLNEPHVHLDMTNRHTLDQIRKFGDQLGDHLLRPETILARAITEPGDETWAARRELAETLGRYTEAKRELRVVDYADLVRLSTEIMAEHPALAQSVRDRYEMLVLDEYQDTNPAQRVLMTTIFGDGFPVVAVGDEDQTIYEWRGASSENFEQFLAHFPTADGTPAHDTVLTLNRRSGDGIIRVANDIRSRANVGAEMLEAANDVATEVVTYWAQDALAEAEWVARQFEALHDNGVRWSDMAVLFRKNKDFAIFIDVLGRHDIPLEVANVGGLLSVPEISLIRAWLTILQNPDDSTALAQILFGTTYRLGLADLAPLTRWQTAAQPDREDDEEPQPVTLIEAVEHATDVEGLRDEARHRLIAFGDTYRELLVETQGLSLSETCRMILDRIKAWQDVESLPPSSRLTARLNLYRFLDLADDWSPLSGRPSLGAFLDYLIAMEDEPAEELDSARLSGEEAVTLVTVHRAKGLEWENVAIPAVAQGNFPASAGVYPDPVSVPSQLPVEFRLDTSVAEMPDDDTARRAFLRMRHQVQEWRVAYVAVTRAKRRLFVTGAYWYGLPEPRKTPAKPSELFEMIAANDVSVSAGHVDEGPRPEILRTGDEAEVPDPLFPGGWRKALQMAAKDPEALGKTARVAGVLDEYEARATELTERLFSIDDVAPESPPPEAGRTVSVTGLVTYAQCPKRFFWSQVEPLPRRRNPAAVRGNEIHRRIELHQRGQVPFADMSDDLYDSVDGSPAGGGGFAAYESSRFADVEAALVEDPFTLELENHYRVRGRIDAVYIDDDRWEIVDFKSGRPSEDASRMVQLQAYAVAAEDVDFGVPRPGQIDVTFAYLGGGLEERTIRADRDWIDAARHRLGDMTDSIDREEFTPSPGDWCNHCDFLQFCEPGQMAVAGEDAT